MAKKHCEHCGASMVTYKRSLSQGLVHSLKLIAIHSLKETPVPVCALKLTNSEYSAVAKLKLWDFVESITSDGDVSGRGGHYVMTEKGWQFLKGEITVPKQIVVYRNTVIDALPGLVGVKDLLEGWWYKPKVIRESQPYEPQLRLIH